MESDKEGLIRKINGIRGKIGLDTYPAGHMEEKDVEELESLYSSYLDMLNGLEKGWSKKKKTTIILAVFLAAAYFIIFLFPYYGGIIPPLKHEPQEKGISSAASAFSLSTGFGGNKTVFILRGGISAVGSVNVSLDNSAAEYVPLSGSMPLDPNGEMAFFIPDFFCDNMRHAVAVFAENATETVEFNNTC